MGNRFWFLSYFTCFNVG